MANNALTSQRGRLNSRKSLHNRYKANLAVRIQLNMSVRQSCFMQLTCSFHITQLQNMGPKYVADVEMQVLRPARFRTVKRISRCLQK